MYSWSLPAGTQLHPLRQAVRDAGSHADREAFPAAVCRGAGHGVSGVCVSRHTMSVHVQPGLLRRALELWRAEATACCWCETRLWLQRLRTRERCMVVPG